MQFRREVSDLLFDLPDAFTRTSLTVKQINVIGISLWIICGDHAEQCRFACSVMSGKRPACAFFHVPVYSIQYFFPVILNMNIPHLHGILEIGISKIDGRRKSLA